MGLFTAIFLSEYAPDRVRRVIKPALEILAGIPTIVYGYFALSFVTPLLQKIMPDLLIFNALSAGIVMGLMIIPMVSSLSEDAMLAVPRSLRHAAYALGRNPLGSSLQSGGSRCSLWHRRSLHTRPLPGHRRDHARDLGRRRYPQDDLQPP